MLALDTHALARYYVREGGSARAQEEVARAVVERGTQLFVISRKPQQPAGVARDKAGRSAMH
jgi:hypothetical protein